MLPGERWDEPPTYGILDPQDAASICLCDLCGGEIYPGEDAYTDTPNAPDCQGAISLHKDCLLDWVKDRGVTAVADAFDFHLIDSDTLSECPYDP